MKVLTIGATGAFAGLVVPALKKKGVTVFALVQNEEKGHVALNNGADETVTGSLENEESLLAAAKDMDGVFLIIPAFKDEINMGLNMVSAAEAAGVKKFVFSSVYHPSLSLINHADKRPVEEALYKSGMDYTILQPAMFMQMIAAMWNDAKEHGQIIMPYSKQAKMSYVDYRDVAEAVAIAMTGTTLSYGTFELCSPGMYSRVQLAELMGKELGKNVVAAEIPPEQWLKLPQPPLEPMRGGLLALFKEYDEYGFSGGNSLVLNTILGRTPVTVEQFIKELASY